MMDDAKTREDATLSRRRLFEGIWRPVESVVFALLIRAMNNLIRESRIDLHIQNLGHGVLGRAAQPPIKVTLHRLAALGKILRRPDLAVGETFVDRDWDVAEEDLARLLMALLREDARLEQKASMRLLNAIRQWTEVYFTPNNSERSRRNAAHHYDIGNDLYELFLDPEMLYSCAFYTHDGQGLYEAQRNKLAITLDRLNVAPGMRILDIGCGWGAMTRAIAERDAFATGITLADKQLELAREKVPPHLEGHIEYHLEDYRIHAAKNPAVYDRVVSIGMFEHVGRSQFEIYFKAIQSLLKPGGRAVVHSIVKDTTSPTNAWVEKYIFPGGYIPRIEDMAESARSAGLDAVSAPYVHDGRNYAQTLRHWRERFNRRFHELDPEKYDERFRRMWNFYLAGSEAAFDGLGFRVAQIVVENAASATNRSRPQRHPSPARPIRRKKTERSDVHDRDRNPRQV